MAVFIELTTSPLDDLFSKVRGNMKDRSARAGRSVARRPMRGVEVKDDTYATIRVIMANGQDLKLVDSSSADGGTSNGYSNFILQSVQEQRMEKHQIIETFGASYVFFFGEQPRFLQCSAILINSLDFNWEAEWWANYNTYLRGTKLVEMGARCYLGYDDTIIEGYMMMASAVKTSDQQFQVQLQFQFFVTNCMNVSTIGPQYPIRQSVVLPDGIDLRGPDGAERLTSVLRGQALASQQSQSFYDAGIKAARALAAGDFGANRLVSQLMRAQPPSVSVSADWFPILEDYGYDLTGNQGRDTPIRGLIADNLDEYVGLGVPDGQRVDLDTVGAGQNEFVSPSVGYRSIARSTQESQDIFNSMTQALQAHGADADNPSAYRGMGVLPYMSPYGQQRATFAPVLGARAGFGAAAGVSAGIGLGAVAGGSAGFNAVQIGRQNTGFNQGPLQGFSNQQGFTNNSLGAVYGQRATTQVVGFGVSAGLGGVSSSQYSYGYPSAYAPLPGYGRAGYGDFGGSGYGGPNRLGDPGYLRADRFTFNGVADSSAAYRRFNTPLQDRTALTPGLRVGQGDVQGGAVTFVGGKLSVFSLSSVSGTLDPYGTFATNQGYLNRQSPTRQYGYQVPSRAPGQLYPQGLDLYTANVSLTPGGVGYGTQVVQNGVVTSQSRGVL